jgi:two-component system chemotaxis response regulator CheB
MGGMEALRTLVAGLPADLPAAVCIVLHVGAYGIGLLPKILAEAGPLPALNARDRMELEHGHIYVAPPDQHLVIERPGLLRLSRGPKENRTRPAIDPLFRSAAVAYGSRAIGVVLTGWLDDGTAGLWAIKEQGGIAVQHPDDAVAPDMPLNALKHVDVNYCVPLKEIPPLLSRLTQAPTEAKGTKPVPEKMELEVKVAIEDEALEGGIMDWGEPSVFACPECHGVLLQLKEGSHLRFRCHTGHAYSIESLLAEFGEKTEDALWNAIRAIEENILLLRRMASQLSGHGHKDEAQAMLKKAEDAHGRAELVRKAVLTHEKVGTGLAMAGVG